MAPLSPAERERIRSTMERFKQALLQDHNTSIRDFLPPREDVLFGEILEALVKVDLEIRLGLGDEYNLDYYIQYYPELGDPATIPARLIYTEFRLLQLYGHAMPLERYRERFPKQYPQLERLIALASTPGTTSAGVLPPSTQVPAIPQPTTDSPRPSPIANPAQPTVVEEHPSFPPTNKIAVPNGEEYPLIEFLGRGRFGEVWRTEAPGGFPAALKLVYRTGEDDKPGSPDRIAREEKALEAIKRLSHPHLLRTTAAWSLDPYLLILMELADCTLWARLKQWQNKGKQGIPLGDLLPYMAQAAGAIDYLHESGLLHRDIKPMNLLLCNEFVKVADFGLMLEEEQNLIRQTCAGSPGYMAPEVWNGSPARASDQYALAITYAELRLGRFPFNLEDQNVQWAHLHDKPDLAGMEKKEIAILYKALAKDPDKRFPNCAAFVEALQRALKLSYKPEPRPAPAPAKPAPAKPPEPQLTAPHPRPDQSIDLVQMGEPPLAAADQVNPFATTNRQTGSPSLAPVGSKTSLQKTVGAEWPSESAYALPEPLFGEEPPPNNPGRRRLLILAAIGLVVLCGIGVLLWWLSSRPPTSTPPTTSSPVVPTTSGPKQPRYRLPPALDGKYEPEPNYSGDGFPPKLRRKEKAAGVPVILVLLRPENDNRFKRGSCFYLMENKVWNGLYRELVQGHRGREDSDLPAMDVTWAQARKFARSLGGDLPTPEQLDFAAGYPAMAAERKGPARNVNQPRVAVGGTPRSVTEPGDDISPLEINDLSGNGYEWTRDDTVIIGDKHHARLRGRPFTMPLPLSYADLEKWNNPNSDLFMVQKVDTASPYTGFRVAFPCEEERE
jgi:serine/threonine protein kinase